ncbi:MAG: alpha/beta hydrolase family protein [Gammaproteobacteria bacterium]|nr:alpha/beta hydrolase family protein [Gammaproteobacteria bacterium]MDH5777439.1 alpha/beta hydrolase family protein [Gammaproteobacteria bacterium]
MTLRTLLIISCLIVTPLSQASDLAKEKRWRAQIVDALIVGEEVTLKAGKTEFLGIFAEHNTEKAVGGAIVLHGIGAHPAWPEVINPLRAALPEHGWSTLSLQLPILANEKKYPDYAPLFDDVIPRIQAGVDYYKKMGVENIVIIAHSMGAAMASYYLASKPDPSVRAYVAIGMSVLKPDDTIKDKKQREQMKKMDTSLTLRKVKLPVLDMYGSRDLPAVIKTIKARRTAANKAGNKQYTQLKVDGADHFFNNMDEILIKRVRGWLANHAAGMEIKK